jgi:hypothetical protein
MGWVVFSSSLNSDVTCDPPCLAHACDAPGPGGTTSTLNGDLTINQFHIRSVLDDDPENQYLKRLYPELE